MLCFILALALALVSVPAGAATFSDTQVFTWSPGQIQVGTPTTEVDPQIYTDLAGTFSGTASYDDSTPLVFSTCLNPVDPSDCYPVFAGVAGVGLNIEITIGGTTFDETDFGPTATVAVIPDGKFLFNPTNPGVGLPGFAFDLVGLSSQFGAPGAGGILFGPNDRWRIIGVSWFATFAADTLADPFGNSLAGVNLFNLGTSREIVFTVEDRNDGSVGTAIARNPEPTTALLLGVGLCGLALTGRRGDRPNSGAPPDEAHAS